MATPALFNLDESTRNPVIQGASFSASVTAWTVLNTTALDLTGKTLKAQVKEQYSSKDPSLTFGCTIMNATAGVFSISASMANTSSLITTKRYVYDLNATTTAGIVDYLMRGTVQVIPRVTQ